MEHGFVYALNSDGVILEGFPFETGDQIWGAPAVADLDLDGQFEMIIASKNGTLNIISLLGEIELNLDLNQFLMGTPAIGNFDMDDELEIAIAGYSNSSNLYVINHNGTFVDGFPLSVLLLITRSSFSPQEYNAQHVHLMPPSYALLRTYLEILFL